METISAKRQKLEDKISSRLSSGRNERYCTENGPSDGSVMLKSNIQPKTEHEDSVECGLDLQKVPLGTQSNLKWGENDVGITEYMSLHKSQPVSGILKQRYSDFLVSEREIDETLVVLTSCQLPDDECVDSLRGGAKDVAGPREYAKLESELRNIITESDYENVFLLSTKKEMVDPVLLSVQDNKDDRRKLHTLIKTHFSNLESDTVEETPGSKRIRVFKKNKRPHNRTSNYKSNSWPENLPKYCHFTLYKENMDTMDAVNLMSKFLHVRPSVFTYAGTKDRRAITVQRICAYMIRASRLQNLNKKLRNCCLGDFQYNKFPLKLGDLSGNHFSVTLRDVQGDVSGINISMEQFSEHGFINYFGMQRFGTGCVPTHHIGKVLLSSEWEKAVSLILQPRAEGNSYQQDAKEYWVKTKDPQKAYQMLTNKRCIEGYLLQGLINFGAENYLNSLQQIPRNTRLMYVHAFQSFIWNTIVSRRLKVSIVQ